MANLQQTPSHQVPDGPLFSYWSHVPHPQPTTTQIYCTWQSNCCQIFKNNMIFLQLINFNRDSGVGMGTKSTLSLWVNR